MTTQSLKDRLTFSTDTGESVLPPECTLIVLTSSLTTPTTFLEEHFLHELMKSPKDETVAVVSFWHGEERLASSMKKYVFLPDQHCI